MTCIDKLLTCNLSRGDPMRLTERFFCCFLVCVCACVLVLGGLGVRLFVSVHSFFSFSFLYFSLNWYLLLDWMLEDASACPSLICFFVKGDIEGTNSWKVWCLSTYVLFYYLCRDWFCKFDWRKYIYVYIYKSFENTCICICIQQVDRPEVTLRGWQDVKILLLINLLTSQLHCHACRLS